MMTRTTWMIAAAWACLNLAGAVVAADTAEPTAGPNNPEKASASSAPAWLDRTQAAAADWHAPGGADGQQVIFVGQADHDAPTLPLAADLFNDGPVTIRLHSDGAELAVHSGDERLTLTLSPQRENTIRLDGRADAPTVEVNSRPVPAALGRWLRMRLHHGQETVHLALPGATWVNVTVIPAGTSRQAPQGLADLPGWRSEAPRFFPASDEPAASHAPEPAHESDASAPSVGAAASDSASAADAEGNSPPAGSAQPSSGRLLAPPSRETAPSPAAEPVTRPQPKATRRQIHEQAGLFDPLNPSARWGFELEVNAISATHSFFRGIGQENQDLILQFHVDGSIVLFEDPAALFFNRWSIDAGFISHHHWGPSGAGASGRKWYEFDFWGGMTVGLFERFELSVYPRQRVAVLGGRPDVHMVDIQLAYDDRHPDYDFQLSPYVLVSVEYENQSDAGRTARPKSLFSHGVYLELGVHPVFELFRLGQRVPVLLETPVRLGFSLGDYFEDPEGNDDVFGFAEVGFDLRLPLITAPSSSTNAFNVSIFAGVHLLYLGDAARDITAFNGAGDDSFVVMGRAGLTLTY